MALLAVVILFAGCSTDGYWDNAPAVTETKYSFDQQEATYAVAGTETLTEINVPMTRNTKSGTSTVAVKATFSDAALSGPSEVTFADGSNTAIYKVSVGDIKVGVSYSATLAIDSLNRSASGVAVSTVKVSKSYAWVSAGSVQFYSSWSGMIGDEGLVGNGVKVEVQRADGGDGLYRLVSPYYISETAAGATGDTLKEGYHIQFIVNAADGKAVGFPSTTQRMGEASADDGNYYFAYTAGKNNCSFTNDGNMYVINALVGYDGGGSSVSLGWYETVAFVWNEGYPW